MYCIDDCEQDLPVSPSQTCTTEKRRGGGRRGAFMKCNKSFTDPTDPAEWTAKIEAGDVVATGELLGQKPKPSFTKKKFSSARPEEVTGVTEQFQFKDFNASLDDNGDLVFWDTIQTNYQRYVYGFVDDHDNFYGFYDNWSPEIGSVIEEDVDGNTYVDGVLTFKSSGVLVPVQVPGLNNILATTKKLP